MVDHTGFEPVTPCMSSKCSNRAELMIHRVRMVPETGIEPVTLSLEGSCSSTELPGQKQSSERISRKEKKSNRIYTKKFSSIIREFDCLCTYNTLYTEPFIF